MSSPVIEGNMHWIFLVSSHMQDYTGRLMVECDFGGIDGYARSTTTWATPTAICRACRTVSGGWPAGSNTDGNQWLVDSVPAIDTNSKGEEQRSSPFPTHRRPPQGGRFLYAKQPVAVSRNTNHGVIQITGFQASRQRATVSPTPGFEVFTKHETRDTAFYRPSPQARQRATAIPPAYCAGFALGSRNTRHEHETRLFLETRAFYRPSPPVQRFRVEATPSPANRFSRNTRHEHETRLFIETRITAFFRNTAFSGLFPPPSVR